MERDVVMDVDDGVKPRFLVEPIDPTSPSPLPLMGAITEVRSYDPPYLQRVPLDAKLIGGATIVPRSPPPAIENVPSACLDDPVGWDIAFLKEGHRSLGSVHCRSRNTGFDLFLSNVYACASSRRQRARQMPIACRIPSVKYARNRQFRKPSSSFEMHP